MPTLRRPYRTAVSVPARRDGFVKIKGMLVNPQAVADILAADAGIADFQAIVDKEDENDALSMDRLRIRLSPREAATDDLSRRVVERIKSATGVRPVIELVAADDASFSGRGWKAKPIIDLRKRPQ